MIYAEVASVNPRKKKSTYNFSAPISDHGGVVGSETPVQREDEIRFTVVPLPRHRCLWAAGGTHPLGHCRSGLLPRKSGRKRLNFSTVGLRTPSGGGGTHFWRHRKEAEGGQRERESESARETLLIATPLRHCFLRSLAGQNFPAFGPKEYRRQHLEPGFNQSMKSSTQELEGMPR